MEEQVEQELQIWIHSQKESLNHYLLLFSEVLLEQVWSLWLFEAVQIFVFNFLQVFFHFRFLVYYLPKVDLLSPWNQIMTDLKRFCPENQKVPALSRFFEKQN